MPDSALIQENTSIEPRTFESIFYSPSSIVAIFNAAAITKEEKKPIQVKGIFKKNRQCQLQRVLLHHTERRSSRLLYRIGNTCSAAQQTR